MALNLHRTSPKPDWAAVAPSSRSSIQKLAVATHGIVTPGNVVSVIGLVMVVYGLVALLRSEYWTGIILIAGGRLLDVVDGLVAEASQTKSPLGEIVDAAFDKIGTLLTGAVLFAIQIAPWWIVAALLIPQVVIPLVVFYNRQRGVAVHPTRAGKISMALTWAGIAGLLIAKAVMLPQIALAIIYSVVGISFLLGVYAVWQYATGRD